MSTDAESLDMEIISTDAESIGVETLHEFLELHFRELRERRQEGIPVFALEHGLNPDEREQLKKSVRGVVPGRKKSWLPWIVHATEIGYGFSGQEYWKTFREETPGWWEYGNREWLREKFQQFSDEYGGVEPKGAWAEHYSFVAWPVANAILAGDLRNHLVDILHAARDTLGSRDWQNAARLGQQIRIRAQSRSHVSRRFVQFTQQERLVGHIASALLFSEKEIGQVLIEETALDRIVSSLEQERLTQLREASRSAQEGKAEGRRADTVESAVRALRATLSIRPTGKEKYRASLEIPGLDPLLEVNEEFETALNSSDVKIKGAQQNRFPPRTLASGPTEVRLKKWALPGSTLVEFEDAPDEDPSDEVAEVLNKHLFNTGSSPWLFKLRKDGKGKNIRSRTVRPGNSYVVAGSEAELAGLDFGTPVEIRADGITGHRVDLEDPLNGHQESVLQGLGFKVKGEVDVWPVGVVPASYDGQEEATWLTTDTPMLAVHSNLAVNQYEIDLNGGEATFAVAAPGEEPVFVKVPGLNVGAHSLIVSAETSCGRQEKQIQVKVRRPEQDRGEKAKIWPLHVKVGSPTAGMEKLWENEIDLSAQGPKDREVKVSLELHTQDSVAPLASESDSMSLPITAADWRQFVHEHCLSSSEIIEYLDEAYKATVTIEGGIIGSEEISFERRHALLRWKLVEEGGARKMQLLDDTDQEQQTKAYRYDPEQPLEATPHPGGGPEVTYEAHSSGGLWHAKADDQTAIRVVPPVDAEIESDYTDIGGEPEEIVESIRALGLWSSANTRGKGSISLQRTVLAQVQEGIVRELCGPEWMKKEKQWRNGPTREARSELEAMVDKTPGRTNPVRKALTSDDPPGTEELTTWIRDNRWLQQRQTIKNIGDGTRVGALGGLSRGVLARLAIRVMDDAGGVAEWETLNEGIEQLISSPDLARTARAIVLARRASKSSAGSESELATAYP